MCSVAQRKVRSQSNSRQIRPQGLQRQQEPSGCVVRVDSGAVLQSLLEIRMLRFSALAVLLFSPAAILAWTSPGSSTKPAPNATVQGVVADPTGAIVPNAEVDLIDTDGSVAGSTKSGGDGNFQMTAPHAGSFTLVISEQGFETVHLPVTVSQVWCRLPLQP